MIFRHRDQAMDLTDRVAVMGILNVTPDSFSEQGANFSVETAIAAGLQMVEDGADILDVGGESSRPGAQPVTLEEELRRVLPVIRGLRARTDIAISIDTYKAQTAQAALDNGASIINDISGFHRDPQMKRVAAATGAGCILMHMRGTPETMQAEVDYVDIIEELIDYFRVSVTLLQRAGVACSRIVLDPGIGFAKTVEQNLRLLNKLERFAVLGLPLLLGPSRKSFIGKTLGIGDPQERAWGTAAAVSCAVLRGAHILRVHNVAEMRQVCNMTLAIRNA